MSTAVSRRSFLKMVTAAGAAAGTGFFVHPDAEALAASGAPEEVKYSHCVMCNHVPKCGIKAIIKEGKIFRIEKREGYLNNLLCAKGLSSLQEIYEPHRLLYPVKRTNPKGEPSKWQRITWDEALRTIAEKFNGVKEKYGADKVLFMAGDPKEPRTILQRLSFTFGSPNTGTESSVCYTANEVSSKLLYGKEWYTASSITTPGIAPTPDTNCCFIWGNNPAWAMPFSFDRMRNLKKRGVKFVVVDPRVTPTVHSFADIHLQLRPGTDGAMALGLAHMLIRDGNYDREMVEKWVHGWDEYREYVQRFTPEKTAEITGVPVDRLEKAASMVPGGPIIMKTAPAFGHHSNGVNNYRAMMMLVPLTGSLDVPGGHAIINEPLPIDLWEGTYEFARSPELLPKIRHLRADQEYFPVWADLDEQGTVQMNMLPEYVRDGKIRAALTLGVNTMMWPQAHEYKKAFQDMEFVAAADFHENPWTHDYMDMLLPAAVSFERSAPLTVYGRNIFLREPIVKPLGEARSDWRICCDIGTALGLGEYFYGGGEEAEEKCMREVVRTLHAGISYDDLRAASPGPVSIPMKGSPKFKKWELGLLRPDGKPGFTTKTGKIEFVSEFLRERGFDPLPVYKEPVYSPVNTPELREKYTLLFNSGSREPFYTHSKGRGTPWLRQLQPDPLVRMNPKDAAARGIKHGDWVLLTSPMGKEIKMKARLTNIVLPGCVDMIHGWSQADCNLLVSRDFDPISGFPPYKEGLCEIRKA
ncbi:MAG: molybdopterin-dependent oxidoreductase [Desulfovibrio sp.]|nr:molybdopterin-dependent oxidoreductase [Desulfovibrio sp.]